MTATKVIQQIKAMPARERRKVILERARSIFKCGGSVLKAIVTS